MGLLEPHLGEEIQGPLPHIIAGNLEELASPFLSNVLGVPVKHLAYSVAAVLRQDKHFDYLCNLGSVVQHALDPHSHKGNALAVLLGNKVITIGILKVLEENRVKLFSGGILALQPADKPVDGLGIGPGCSDRKSVV